MFNFLKLKKTKNEPFNAALEGQKVEGELDILSPTWRFVKDRTEKRIQELRERNDAFHFNEVKTGEIRGRIAELKTLLELENEEK